MIICLKIPTAFYYSLIGIKDIEDPKLRNDNSMFWIQILIENIYKIDAEIVFSGFGFDHFEKSICLRVFGPIEFQRYQFDSEKSELNFFNLLNKNLEKVGFPSKIIEIKIIEELDIEYFDLNIVNSNNSRYKQFDKLIICLEWNSKKWKSFLKGKTEFDKYYQNMFTDIKLFNWIKTQIYTFLNQNKINIVNYEIQSEINPNMYSLLCDLKAIDQNKFPVKDFQEFWMSTLAKVKDYGVEFKYLYPYCSSIDFVIQTTNDNFDDGIDKLKWNSFEESWEILNNKLFDCEIWPDDIIFWMNKRTNHKLNCFQLNLENDKIETLTTKDCLKTLLGLIPQNENLKQKIPNDKSKQQDQIFKVAGVLPLIKFNKNNIFVLLQKRNPNMISLENSDQNYWNIISGHTETNENLLQTIYREMKEELGDFNLFGCSIQKIVILNFRKNPKNDTMDFPLFVIQYNQYHEQFLKYTASLKSSEGSFIEIDKTFEPKYYKLYNLPKPPKGYDWFNVKNSSDLNQEIIWGPKEDPLRTLRTIKIASTFFE